MASVSVKVDKELLEKALEIFRTQFKYYLSDPKFFKEVIGLQKIKSRNVKSLCVAFALSYYIVNKSYLLDEER